MEKLRKVIASLGVIAMLSTLMVTSVATAEWYDDDVEALVTAGVIDSAEGYRPGDKITRSELVVFAVAAFSLEGSTEIDFSDVSADAAYYADLQTAVANGVVKGYEDGTFKPEAPVLRSELVKILVEAGDLPECEVENPFTDIPTGAEGWYKDYAVTAYCNSVVDGINNGEKFGGAMDTARSSAAKMVSMSMTPVIRADATVVVEEVVVGDLEGGAGSITITSKSTYSDEEVGEGEEEVKVMAFEIEADDSSDVEITSLKVGLEEMYSGGVGSPSDKLDQYVETVYVLFDGEVVGEADADAFSENSDVYTKFITLDDSIIRMGEEGVFTIAVTSVGNLDSGDIEYAEWEVWIENVRFIDAEGVVTTEATGDIEEAFEFASFASANNVELEADLTDENPEEGVVIGDDSDETEVLMLSFTYTPDGTDVNLDELTFDIETGTADNDEVAQDLMLRWEEEEQSESIEAGEFTVDSAPGVDADSDGDATNDYDTAPYEGTVSFEDLDIDIDEDEEMVFEVWATINEIDGATVEEGEVFVVSLDVDSTVATDEEDEDVEDLSGSADGETQHLFTVAPAVTYVSSSIEVVDNGASPAESATAELVVDITALGGTVYLNGDDEDAALQSLLVAATGIAGIDDHEFALSGDYTITDSGGADEYYKLTEGKTMTVTITATITAASTSLCGLEVEGVQFGTDEDDDGTRSANLMDWADLTDSLKTPKTTLVI